MVLIWFTTSQINTNNERRRRKYDIKYYVGCEDKILATLKDKCGFGNDFSEAEILTAMGLAEMYGVTVANGAKGASLQCVSLVSPILYHRVFSFKTLPL